MKIINISPVDIDTSMPDLTKSDRELIRSGLLRGSAQTAWVLERMLTQAEKKILETEKRHQDLNVQIRKDAGEQVRGLREALEGVIACGELAESGGISWWCVKCDEEALIGEEVEHLPDCVIGIAYAALASTAPVAECANCGHANPHNSPAGEIADACNEATCNCGYYTPVAEAVKEEGE